MEDCISVLLYYGQSALPDSHHCVLQSYLKVTYFRSLVTVGTEGYKLGTAGKVDQSHGCIFHLIIIRLPKFAVEARKAFDPTAEGSEIVQHVQCVDALVYEVLVQQLPC